jgi:signal transduction histidine kinase
MVDHDVVTMVDHVNHGFFFAWDFYTNELQNAVYPEPPFMSARFLWEFGILA